MDLDLVGGAGDPFVTVPSTPVAGAQPVAGTPEGGAGAPPQYVTKEQYDAQQARLARLEPLEKVSWLADALSDPTTRARVTSLLAGQGAGAAPAYSSSPIDLTGDIRSKYKAVMQQALQAGDMEAYGEAAANMGAEIAEARGRANLETAAGPILNLNAQTAIESFFNSKRNDPRVGPVFSKIEPRLRDFIGRTSPADMARMVSNGSLMSSLEGAFKMVVADTYLDGYANAAAAGKLGAAPQNVPAYSAGTRGGAPPILPTEHQGDDDADDAAFLELMKKSGMNVKFTGNASGSNIVAEIQ